MNGHENVCEMAEVVVTTNLWELKKSTEERIIRPTPFHRTQNTIPYGSSSIHKKNGSEKVASEENTLLLYRQAHHQKYE